MSLRHSRPGEEDKAYRPKGAAVFRPAKDDPRPVVYIPVGGTLLRCRWPAQTARKQTGVEEMIITEVIYMKDRVYPKRPLLPDPYGLED